MFRTSPHKVTPTPIVAYLSPNKTISNHCQITMASSPFPSQSTKDLPCSRSQSLKLIQDLLSRFQLRNQATLSQSRTGSSLHRIPRMHTSHRACNQAIPPLNLQTLPHPQSQLFWTEVYSSTAIENDICIYQRQI